MFHRFHLSKERRVLDNWKQTGGSPEKNYFLTLPFTREGGKGGLRYFLPYATPRVLNQLLKRENDLFQSGLVRMYVSMASSSSSSWLISTSSRELLSTKTLAMDGKVRPTFTSLLAECRSCLGLFVALSDGLGGLATWLKKI